MVPVNWFMNMIEDGDAASSLFLLVCLSCIGRRVLESRPNLAGWCRRIGFGSLLAYVAYRSVTERPTNPDQLLWILLRGLLAAAFVTTVTWIVLPVCVSVWSVTVGRFMKAAGVAHQATQARQQERRVAAQRHRERMVNSRNVERHTPERDRQQQEAEARARVDRDAAESANRKREEARLRSELLYERHARQLASSFPRERFEQFVERYMSDTTAAELVVQREQLLREMIVDSLGTATAPKFPSMTELAAYFAARRQEIDSLPHAEEVKDTYRVQLNKQEDEALRRFLKP